MKFFDVIATITKEVELRIQAESLEEAQEQAKDLSSNDFGPYSRFNVELGTIEEKIMPYAHLKEGK